MHQHQIFQLYDTICKYTRASGCMSRVTHAGHTSHSGEARAPENRDTRTEGHLVTTTKLESVSVERVPTDRHTMASARIAGMYLWCMLTLHSPFLSVPSAPRYWSCVVTIEFV